MAKKPSKLERKVNDLARVTFLDENGRPKSAAWLYAFLFAILYAVVYIAIYILSGMLLGQIWPQGSVWAIVLQYLATALIGSGLCLLTCLFLKGKRRAFVYYAYIWLAILLLMMIPTSLFMVDWAGGNGWLDFWQFAVMLFFPAILSILAGGIPARILWHHELRKEEQAREKEKEKEASRPSYYNT